MALDTLNEFLPKDTDPVSMGDDAIRETRAATKASVGLEHYLNGYHKIPSGTTALRPPAGNVGRLYWNTDNRWLEYDNGASWIAPPQRKASGAILWHGAEYAVASGATVELPFDSVLYDSGGYAVPSSHQIVMPAGSMGTISLYLSATAASGGFNVGIANIEQFDPTGAIWRTLASVIQPGPWGINYSLNTLAHSGWGQNLRATFTNASGIPITIHATALGASPRFGYVLHGSTT